MNRVDTKASEEHIELDDQGLNKQPVGNVDDSALKSSHDQWGLLKTAINFRKAVLVCTLLCVAAAADGYQINLNGNIIANTGFVNHVGYLNSAGKYTLNAQYTALWGALQSLGQFIGMVFFNPVSDKIGRKMTLYVLWCVLFASIMIETFVHTWRDWAGAKLLAGVGVGCIQSTLPIYVTEWSPVNIRGGMILAYTVWNNVGNFLAPMILYVVGKHNPLEFKIPIYTQWVFLGIMAPIFFWLPETASYFASRDQDERGKAALKRVNGKVPGYNVEQEYAITKNVILEERHARAELGLDSTSFKDILSSYVECFNRANLRRTLGAALPITIQQLTGLSFLNTYASLFFRQSGFTNAFLITTILTVLKIVTIIGLVFTTDRFGRRKIVIAFSAICTAMMLVVGILGQVEKTKPLQNALIVFACFWSMANSGLGALGWTYVGEVSSQRLRARTAGLAAAISVLFGLTFNTSVPIMLDVNGANWGYNTAWFFFGTGLIATAGAWYFVPETAKRSTPEMDEMYAKGIPAWRMRTYVSEVQARRVEAH